MTDRIFIALTLLISVLLMGVLGGTVNAVAIQRVQEEGLQGLTADLRARLETDLRVGLPLSDNRNAQTMLERAVAHADSLDSVEIDSDTGKVLYSSDRALQGQDVPASWQEAMRATPSSWRVSNKGERSVGTALRDATGQIVGYLVSTRRVEQDHAVVTLPLPVLWIALSTALLYVFAGRWMERPQSDLREATAAIEQARNELENVNQEAHHIAGLEA